MSYPTDPASSGETLPLPRALALGLLHGPAELLPVSSSAHTNLASWLLGWELGELEPGLRKSFEVALHAGTAAGLAILIWSEGATTGLWRGRGWPGRLGLTLAPPAATGYALGPLIATRLGTPLTILPGLVGGSLLMAVADRAPDCRSEASARARDALWLGLAQALALAPGVSRAGATMSVLRLRGFSASAATRLSWQAAVAVIAAATAREAVELSGVMGGRAARRTLAVGAGAAFVSSLASRPLLRHLAHGRALLPYATYRLVVAGVVIARLRRPQRSIARPSPGAPP